MRTLTAFENQLVGLIMGEGCFTFGRAVTPCPVPRFVMAMTETELPVLRQAQAALGGTIDRTEYYTLRNPKQRPVCRWSVSGDAAILRVVELCESCELKSRKALELPHIRLAIELRRIDNPHAKPGPGRYRPRTIALVKKCIEAVRMTRETGLAQPLATTESPYPLLADERKVG